MKKISVCVIAIFALVLLLPAQPVLSAETAQEWFKQGVSFEDQHIYGEAVRAYTSAVKEDPNHAESYFRRGKINAMIKPSNCVMAVDDFTRVIDLQPDNAEAYYERGLLHAFMINNEQAKSDMRMAAALGHKGAMKWLNPDAKEEKIVYVKLGDYLSTGEEPIIYFDFDKSIVKKEYRALLRELSEVLDRDLPNVYVVLLGHADEIGTEQYNDKLSVKRAGAVKNILTSRNTPGKRIIARGYGESRPAVPNKTEEGRSLNRRVEIVGIEHRQ